MNESETIARARAEAYRMMASVYYRELDESQIDCFRQNKLPGEGNEALEAAAKDIYRYFRLAAPEVLSLLRVDYARVFLAAGVYEGDTAVPYESVFTSEDGLMMQGARDDALEYYRREEVTVDPTLQTPEDHLSFELEFLAILCDREADACARGNENEVHRLQEVQASFANAHVLNWIRQLAERVDAYAAEAFYPAFVRYTEVFVEEDVAALEGSDD